MKNLIRWMRLLRKHIHKGIAVFTTEDQFQNYLDEHITHHMTRLVFADYLEDIGDPRAEGYRVLGKLKKRPRLTYSWRNHNTSYMYVSSYHKSQRHVGTYIHPKWIIASLEIEDDLKICEGNIARKGYLTNILTTIGVVDVVATKFKSRRVCEDWMAYTWYKMNKNIKDDILEFYSLTL